MLAEIRRIHDEIRKGKKRLEKLEESLSPWIAVAEPVGLDKLLTLKKVKVDTGNIAGINIPVFEGIELEKEGYDLMKYPLWVDKGIEAVREYISLEKELEYLEKQEALIQKELRTTVQRINLFEKVMIPRTEENIRRIRIFMGDQETAAVVRGKIWKAKIERKNSKSLQRRKKAVHDRKNVKDHPSGGKRPF
ncbi:MAG: V-type ATP synthase subunit D [Candidatus Marinimicrobia bacterium]|nr:V-type ATP synthase subunit D [Candidatus Neomarinimicrobiota bacterium]